MADFNRDCRQPNQRAEQNPNLYNFVIEQKPGIGGSEKLPDYSASTKAGNDAVFNSLKMDSDIAKRIGEISGDAATDGVSNVRAGLDRIHKALATKYNYDPPGVVPGGWAGLTSGAAAAGFSLNETRKDSANPGSTTSQLARNFTLRTLGGLTSSSVLYEGNNAFAEWVAKGPFGSEYTASLITPNLVGDAAAAWAGSSYRSIGGVLSKFGLAEVANTAGNFLANEFGGRKTENFDKRWTEARNALEDLAKQPSLDKIQPVVDKFKFDPEILLKRPSPNEEAINATIDIVRRLHPQEPFTNQQKLMFGALYTALGDQIMKNGNRVAPPADGHGSHIDYILKGYDLGPGLYSYINARTMLDQVGVPHNHPTFNHVIEQINSIIGTHDMPKVFAELKSFVQADDQLAGPEIVKQIEASINANKSALIADRPNAAKYEIVLAKNYRDLALLNKAYYYTSTTDRASYQQKANEAISEAQRIEEHITSRTGLNVASLPESDLCWIKAL